MQVGVRQRNGINGRKFNVGGYGRVGRAGRAGRAGRTGQAGGTGRAGGQVCGQMGGSMYYQPPAGQGALNVQIWCSG